MVDALSEGDPAGVMRSFAEPASESDLARQRTWIDACYSAPGVEEILVRLRQHDEAASSAAKEIEGKSPTALKVTLRALRSAAELPDLETVLAQEFRVSTAALHIPDFAEGIRARIIDKDRTPAWSPATLAEVTDERVESFFAPLGAEEWTATRSATTSGR
ncbi:enoyl-CoA hydratase/isomerase family protein [Amycolatopsis sp. H20-H5]|uniref:enoyl-CoA hydratase/isomerase family protein n=1 Tax=Amycolatopsis sp. H20-H5 TaxID=3046309 RepID=UPI002DB68993|nr:enoyl-CoA hydratase/isomerase family protein [Amycolatopsis sp. H20-H5]MEC3976038.1 enoyl-CoA hydratase/isomerase family protein [Amycolatopsis sp. H20-H5]